MDVQELKRAITLLKILRYEDLIKFNQILISQNDYIGVVLEEKRKHLIRFANRKNTIGNIFNELNLDITNNYISPMGNHISLLQSSLSNLSENVKDVMGGAAILVDSYFEGNIFALKPEFKTALNNYAGDETIVIYANTSQSIISSISSIIRDYIDNIEINNTICKIHNNIFKKSDKMMKALANEILNIMSIRNKVKTLLSDTNNAQAIKNQFSEKELERLLSRNFSQIRGELNV